MLRLDLKIKSVFDHGCALASYLPNAVLSASVIFLVGSSAGPYCPFALAAHSVNSGNNGEHIQNLLAVSVEGVEGKVNGVAPNSSLALAEQHAKQVKLLTKADLRSAGSNYLAAINAAKVAATVLVLILILRCFRFLSNKAGQRRLMGEDDDECSVRLPEVLHFWHVLASVPFALTVSSPLL